MDTRIAYVDVEVLRVQKGTGVSERIRVWDAGFGTSCGGRLDAVIVGAEYVLALERVSESTSREMWTFTGINPATGDYIVGMCGRFLKPSKEVANSGRPEGSRWTSEHGHVALQAGSETPSQPVLALPQQ
jgi:hypothetical protein